MRSRELFIGLMSGTSADGIDAALVEFKGQQMQLLAHYAMPFADDMRNSILALCSTGVDEIERMGRLHTQLGECYADCVNQLMSSDAINTCGISARDILAIGCHGQTIRHRPEGHHPFTLQMGNAAVVAERTGITTINDFRSRDIAAGGQGAPLVPAFHDFLLHSDDNDRVILNLGGIANITLLWRERSKPVSGFDTGPANMLMDAWIQRHLKQPFDQNGDWSASGRINSHLLLQLLAEPWLQLPPPKSTGRELFSLHWLERQLNTLQQSLAAEDVQATLLEFTAETVAQAIRQYGPAQGQLIVCGGGALNTRLRQRLAALLPYLALSPSDDHGLPAQQVEACAFAWLARQTWLRQPGNLPAVTGARHPVVLGAIYPV